MDQWIRPRIVNREAPGPGSNLLPATAVVLVGKALYTHSPIPRKELKTLVHWLFAYKQLAFLVVW